MANFTYHAYSQKELSPIENLIQAINITAIEDLNNIASKKDRYSAILWLSYSEKGRKILKMFKEQKPEVFEDVFEDLVIFVNENMKGKVKNHGKKNINEYRKFIE